MSTFISGILVHAIFVLTRMNLGLVTFADITPGSPPSSGCGTFEEAGLADELGLNVFAIGEHHRRDYLVSSPATVLAGDRRRHEADPARERGHRPLVRRPRPGLPAVRTRRPDLRRPSGDHGRARLVHRVVPALRLRPATTTTSCSRRSSSCCSRSATTSASPGRAEHRAPLKDAGVWPRPVQDSCPIWVAVGGTPRVGRAGGASRAAAGARDHRRPDGAVQAVRRSLPARLGRDRARAASRGSRSTPTRSSPTRARQADAAFAAPYLEVMNRIGRERGWPPSGRAEYEALAAPAGPLAVGSPEEVAEKIVSCPRAVPSPSATSPTSASARSRTSDVMRAIELFGTQVAPLVRAATPVVPALPAGEATASRRALRATRGSRRRGRRPRPPPRTQVRRAPAPPARSGTGPRR